MKIYALPINVYRSSLGDCTNGGISSKYDKLLVYCPDGFIEIDSDNVPENFVMIENRHVFGNTIIPTIYPSEIKNGKPVVRGGKWYMMGGNYGATSDSRFNALIEGDFYGAVAIHDRYETPEEYEMYSR